MINYTFSLPTDYHFGVGVNAQVGETLAKRGYKKALLHFGGGSIYRNGVYDTVTRSLEAAGVAFVEAGGQLPNPQAHICERAASLYIEHECDVILAVGGGSVLDSAKYTGVCIAVRLLGDNEISAWDIMNNDVYPALMPRLVAHAPAVVAVLTTSATGSEMNGGFVITKIENGKVHKYANSTVAPVASFVDPAVQCTVGPWQTACGAVDVISHCLEALCQVVKYEHTPETAFELAAANVRAVMATLPKALAHPDNVDYRADIAWAATMGLNYALHTPMEGGDWTVHLIEHALSAAFAKPDSTESVTHGAGLGVVTIGYFRWLATQTHRMPEEGVKAFHRILTLVGGSEDIETAMAAWRGHLRAWGLPTSIDELCAKFPAYQQGGASAWIPVFADLTIERGATGNLFHVNHDECIEILNLCN